MALSAKSLVYSCLSLRNLTVLSSQLQPQSFHGAARHHTTDVSSGGLYCHGQEGLLSDGGYGMYSFYQMEDTVCIAFNQMEDTVCISMGKRAFYQIEDTVSQQFAMYTVQYSNTELLINVTKRQLLVSLVQVIHLSEDQELVLYPQTKGVKQGYPSLFITKVSGKQ